MRDAERFLAKVDRTGDCWLWTGWRSRKGYGGFSVGGRAGRDVLAHRWSYEHHVGLIPAGMQVDHICHVPACVNPAHLRLATNKQNQENRSSATARSRSRVRGVSLYRDGRWRAVVGHNGKHIHVGYFATVAEAEAAVIAKRAELFTHA